MTKILVIEDESSIREDILEILNAYGYKALGAENGDVGVQMAQEYLPDLILSDLMLPTISGLEVLKTIRSEPALANTCFAILSAKTDKETIAQCLDCGANYYLTKPIGLQELLDAIETALAGCSKLYEFCNTANG